MRAIIRNKRGAALVEFAIVVILLVTLVFGIIEFGLLIKDYLTLNQAAREGTRSAALLSSATVVEQRVRDSATGLGPTELADLDVQIDQRAYSGGGWGSWTALDSSTTDSDVQVRVVASCDHQTIMGSFLGIGDTITISGNMVMKREKK